MLRAELLKVRSHKLPWIVYAILVAALVIVALVLAGPSGRDVRATDMAQVSVVVQAVLGPLLVIVLGAWIGTLDFRTGTWRIILGRDGRRGLHFANKVGAFLVVVVVAAIVTFAVGMAAVTGAASAHGGTPSFDGFAADLAYILIVQFVYGVIALGLGMITRNFAVSIAIVLVYYVIVDSLLGLLTDVRPFLLGPALGAVGSELAGISAGTSEPIAVTTLSLTRAAAVIAAYVIVILGAAFAIFWRRDVTR